MNFKITKLKEKLLEKLNETLKAVLPIIAIVLVLCFTIAPLEPGILLAFLLGAVFLIVMVTVVVMAVLFPESGNALWTNYIWLRLRI